MRAASLKVRAGARPTANVEEEQGPVGRNLVVGPRRVGVDVEERVDDRGRLEAAADQEEDRHHAAHLQMRRDWAG